MLKKQDSESDNQEKNQSIQADSETTELADKALERKHEQSEDVKNIFKRTKWNP